MDTTSGEEPLHVAPRPCNTCPYLRSTPSGVWAEHEYQKLATYDEDHQPVVVATFHCHQESTTGVPTVCRGWLSVHADSVAVRLGQVMGIIDPATIPLAVEPELYACGKEARDAGLADIAEPSDKAKAAVTKLSRAGVGASGTSR